MKRVCSFAFTLIELLIVVAIIGILAAIALPNFLEAQIRAKVARAQSEERILADAFDSYSMDHGSYPPSEATSANGYGGYRYLTTPVSYLHAKLDDPFTIKYVNNRRNDYDTQYEFMVTRRNSSLDRSGPRNSPSLNMFNIECVGPDGFDHFQPTQAYPSHPDQFEFYDPTNGIRSSGDILRAGGVYLPRWYRERKGGRSTTGIDWI